MKVEYFTLAVVVIVFLAAGFYVFGFSEPNENALRADVSVEGIKADFVLDTSSFGEMSDLANKEVRIAFEFIK
jgi:hypothetical protein